MKLSYKKYLGFFGRIKYRLALKNSRRLLALGIGFRAVGRGLIECGLEMSVAAKEMKQAAQAHAEKASKEFEVMLQGHDFEDYRKRIQDKEFMETYERERAAKKEAKYAARLKELNDEESNRTGTQTA